MKTDDHEQYICRIDSYDLVVGVNEAWREFARRNGAPELADPDALLGRRLWSYFADDTTRHLYQVLTRQIRTPPHDPITFEMHCDGPSVRRLLQMTMRYAGDGCVDFISHMIHEEARPYIELLDYEVDRSSEFTRMCSWCQRLEVPGPRWVDIETAIPLLKLFHPGLPPQITHGMCPDCLHTFMSRNRPRVD